MPKKPNVEADLDPIGTRHTRPGATAAARAVESTKRRTSGSKTNPQPNRRGSTGAVIEADMDPVGSRNTRPGATAAARAVENTKLRTAGSRKNPEPNRPGSTAAARVIEESKRKKTK